MNNIIIGTAGHVDHGKTALIKALTGINTDRLAEEQKRGITIDLGFASLPLPDGTVAGIIDVPGHEKFIKNMLAGAGGMDLVLLVVAADDGVMPQTREHLDILNLLEARSGIVALTKSDLVDEEWIALITEDIRAALAGTFLEGAPIVPVSSHTGAGIEALRALIYEKVAHTQGKQTALPFRMPVDRVFTVGGFGTVITGTLIEGVLREGDEIMVYPSGRLTRARNLQVHDRDVETAYAGQRVAVNLAGLDRGEVARGDTLSPPGTMSNTRMADIKIQALRGSGREIRHNSRLHFYHGARDMLCKISLIDRDMLAPGEACYAQLRFEEDIALKKGDRFILRFYSPLETIGGGVILDPAPTKHKRGDSRVIEALKVRETGTLADHIAQAVMDASPRLAPIAELKKQFSLDEAAFQHEMDTLTTDGRVIPIGRQNTLAPGYKKILADNLTRLLAAYHRDNHLQAGMRRDELRSRLLPGIKTALCDLVLDLFAEEGLIRCSGLRVALTDFTVTYTEDEKALRADIERRFTDAGFTPPDPEDIIATCPTKMKKAAEAIIEAMTAENALIFTEPGIGFAAAVMEEAKAKLCTVADQNEGQIILAQFRDATGTSRKFALSLLEYFDRTGITRKTGDARLLLRNKR